MNSKLFFLGSFVLLLSACGSGSKSKGNTIAALTCNKVSFELGTFQYNDNKNNQQLVINLENGISQLTTADQGCTETVDMSEVDNLKTLLQTASFCGEDSTSQINLEVRSSDNQKSAKINGASDRSVSIKGGFSSFRKDVVSLIDDIKLKGQCTDF